MKIITTVKKLFRLQKNIKSPTQPLTKIYTEVSTGIVRMERPIKRNGQDALAIMEKFPDGKIKTSIKGGGEDYWRTKTISKENGGSIFGGNKITIEKDSTKYWCSRDKTTLTKEYNPDGIMEHAELSLIHDSGNGLNDYTHAAIFDRVYNEYPLSHSIKEMLKSPSEHQYYQHILDSKNNYNYFANKETNYTKTLKAKEQAKLNAEIKANEKALAKKIADEKSLVELKSKQPRINIAKVLGLNIDELKVVEKIQPNGAIKRYYFLPETGTNMRKPVITTYDHGLLHTEKIIGSPMADLIYMKQVGKETPYIISKKGNYTQISKLDEYSKASRLQYYNDGIHSFKREYHGQTTDLPNGKICILDENATNIIKNDSFWAREFPNFPNVRVINGKIMLPGYDGWKAISNKYNCYIQELNKNAKDNLVDLENLFKSYDA